MSSFKDSIQNIVQRANKDAGDLQMTYGEWSYFLYISKSCLRMYMYLFCNVCIFFYMNVTNNIIIEMKTSF